MSASIVLTGLASTDPLPGNYVEVLFAQGPTAGFAGQRPILLIGNKTSAGNAVVDTTVYGPDTPVPALTEQDVINLTGTGSEIHRMWRRARAVAGTSVSIYFICVTASAGTAASKQFTLLNVPTTQITIRQYVGDEFVDYTAASGDTLASITSAISGLINAKTHWPVTAAQSTSATSNDSWTLTARVAGPRGNWIRAMASISAGNGSTPNTTLTGTTDAFLTAGATADVNTTALGNILASRYYYIASAAEDATQAGALLTQVNSQALPTTGIRQRCFFGSVDTQSNVDTIATGLNGARAEVVWLKAGLWTPAELAAHAAALYAVEELGSKPRLNFSGYPKNDSQAALWQNMPAPRDRTAWPTPTVLRTALNNGVTPIGVSTNGKTYLVKRITTKCLTGSTADYRIRDAHKVTIPDFFADDLVTKADLQLGGKNLTDDVAQGQEPPPSDTTTPNRFRDLCNGLINTYAANGLLQKADLTKQEMIVQRDPANSSRIQASIGLYPEDILDSTATVVKQVG